MGIAASSSSSFSDVDPEENPHFSSPSSSFSDVDPEENPHFLSPPSFTDVDPEENPHFSSPSSSGVDPSPCKYDVFISFRGGDTRHNFTGHLYSALCRNHVKTYIDERSLQKGDDILGAFPKAIEESAISIIIFSKDYASSTWCLDELVHILKCKKEKDQTVLPIFLGVNPSDIRKQTGSYGDAFFKHEQRFNNTMDKVQEWRQALIEAGGLSGWDSQVKSEHVIVDEVVEVVKEKLKHIGSNDRIEDLLNNLKEELRLAKEELRLVNRALEDAEEKQLTDEDVREWLLNMKEVNYRADELTEKINCEELRREQGGASESSTSFATLNKSVQDEIAEIRSTLEKLDARKDKLGLKELPENRVSQRSYGTHLVLDSEVFGRGDDKEAILKLLLSDETYGDKVPMVLPIVGMGGIGKTTLAQLVYDDPRVEDHFQIRVWVTVSTEFNVFKITKQIFKRVTSKKFKSEEISELQRELRKELMGKKYFLVLDDVWNEKPLLWEELIPPFKCEKSGGKILITTRSSDVASAISSVKAHNLGELSDKNCWKIFIQNPFRNEDLLNAHPDLQKIGEGIVQKCKGLPLAVKSVAALLHSKSGPDEWRKILENPIWDSELPENARKVLPALWLSYRHLSQQLKRCFAYCSIFPKDHGFDKENLILLWMGEGLLEYREGTRMEDVGEEYFRILTSRSFFQPSVRYYRSCFIMHDCVHDLATFVLGDFGRLEENKNLHNLPSKTRHLSIMRENFHHLKKFDGISNAKCLRTFLPLEENKNLHNLRSKTRHLSIMRENFHDLKKFDGISNAKCLHTFLPLGFFYCCPPLKLLMKEGCLRVLSLYRCRIAELPDSIGNLKHLRYLDLSFNYIKEIPDKICTLYNLETLLLKECWKLTRLPTDIGCLIKLRHLDFSGSSIKELPLHIFNMKDLQTVQPSFILGKEHADSTIKDLGCFPNLEGELRIQGFENLVDAKNVCEAKLRDKKFITELGLCWDGDSKDSMKEREILDQLQPHTNLKKLYMKGYQGTTFSDWMGDQSFSSIVQVDLIRCENCRSLWPLDQLPSLRTLLIEKSFRGVETINWEFFSNSSSMTKPFRSLHVLQFKNMARWKEWLFREGEVVFPTLKELRLIECPRLEVRLLPDCFPSLTRLDVRKCRQVMPFVIPATHQGLIFPSLQELVLEGALTCSFILVREHADSTIKALGCFPNLDGELRIQGFENLVDAKNVCEAKLRDKKFITELGLCWDGDSKDSMKEREILDQLQPHTNLKKLYMKGYQGTRFSDWMGDQFFSSIVQVDLIRCENCRSLWPLDQLPSLRTLLIEKSFRGVETINWEFFSNSSSMTKPFRSLQVLQFKHMAWWKEWLFREGEVVFPTVKELRLFYCPKLEVRLLPDCFSSLTKLVVVDCRQLKLIPATHQGLIFPSLQELDICGCGEQELILEGGLPSSLETITIYKCHNLKALDNNGFRLLTSLRKLEIEYCYKLQCLPELPSYPFDLFIYECPLLYSRCQENGEDWLKIKHARLKLMGFSHSFWR